MTRIFNTTSLSVLFAILFLVSASPVEAGKSVTVTNNNIPVLSYYWNRAAVYSTDTVTLETSATEDCRRIVDRGGNVNLVCGWVKGLERGSNASILYKGKLVNVDTNREITDRTALPVGTRFRVERDTATLATDISWNGTGFSEDSPYGRWVENAGPLPLACKSPDFLNRSSYVFNNVTWSYDTYVLLNVDPVTPRVTGASSNLSCAGNLCTVTGAGAISVALDFPSTVGRFYYRYYTPRTSISRLNPMGCHANNVPMRSGVVWNDYGFGPDPSCAGPECLNTPTYDLTMPRQSITWSLSGVSVNTPPTAPIVNPNPLNGTTHVSYPFSLTTTDADNDRVRFNIDWNNDGITDQQQPSTGFSATLNQSVSRMWNTPGTYSFKVQAEDDKGGFSGWTTAVANIGLAVPTGLTATPNGACGSGSISVAWNSLVTGATSYTLRDGGVDIYTGNTTSFNHTGLAPASSHAYTVRANHASGNSAYSGVVTQNAPADCGAPNLTTLSAPDCSIAVGASTCTTPISWTVLNPVSPVITQNGATIATTPTGSNVTSGPIHFGLDPQNTITVSDTNGQLGSITPEGTCVLGALWDGSVCAQANITSGTVTTPDPLVQNTDITFEAPVTNAGTISTGNAFRDEFSYQWGVNTGTWNSINVVSNGVMNSSESHSDISGSFTLVNTGTLYIQHCVDVTNTIVETDEANCTVTSFTITAPVAGTPEATLTAPSCDIAKGNSSCDTTVTWTSTNVSTPSIRREGAEFSNNPNSNVPQTIAYTDSPVTFTFSDGTTDLVTVDTGAGCASGLIWDGDSCELPATGTITANPPVIPRGGTTNITWTTSNGTNCSVRGGVDSWTGTADTKPSSALSVDTTYVLECDGRSLDSVLVDVQGPDINATPRIVPKVGDPVTVTWNPWGVPGCVVNGGGLLNVDASSSGSRPNVIINGTTDFTITCGGVVEDRVKVEVVSKGFET
jgi:hypothetical protein